MNPADLIPLKSARGSDEATTAGSREGAGMMSKHELDDNLISILLVDDEPKNLTVLETVLDNPAYRLVRASSAEEALLALIGNEFALLILDIHMPGMTGFELAQLIRTRKRNAHVPIIFLTAYYNEDQHVLEGYDSGAVDYLHKPVNPVILRSKVSVFAELHRKHRALLAEVATRRRIEAQLCDLNETLEQRVTERTLALQENEARLRHAASAAGLTYLEIDIVSGQVRTAENFAAVMGYASPTEEQSDLSSCMLFLLEHVVPQDRERVGCAFQEFAKGKPLVKLDYRVLGDDRIERSIESNWFVESDSSGRPRKNFLTNLDITARKAAQEQLRESEQRFRQLADSMPQMVWTAGVDGLLDYYNARWYDFTGFGRERLGEITNWRPLLHPDDTQNCYDSWYASIRSGQPFRTEYRLWDRHSQRFCWYLARALPVQDEEGRTIKWFGTCTEIDDQKRSEEDLRRANRALEQFAYAASHDLQEPLRNISLYTQLFERRYSSSLNDEGKMYLGTVTEGARRMIRLVSDLLQYTQIVNTDPEHRAVSDAGKVIAAVLENFAHTVEEKHAVVTYDTLPSVSIQEVHLGQLLQNLIGNALKYHKDDVMPQVHVSAVQEKSRWHFVVQDNGIGIAPEYLSKVFGVFKRYHASGEKYSGTGIGLAICQRIVESYGGRIWVESDLGQGATFHFTLPAS